MGTLLSVRYYTIMSINRTDLNNGAVAYTDTEIEMNDGQKSKYLSTRSLITNLEFYVRIASCCPAIFTNIKDFFFENINRLH